MTIKDLKDGDVLLFSAEKGSFVSWAITFLTNAPVSHAAMFFSEKNEEIIEETPPRVSVNEAMERFKGREIYVRRLKKDLPMSPVIQASKKYLNDKEPYDDSGLYIIGALLIYRKFTPHTWAQKVIIKILRKITASIVNYIHKHQDPGKHPMVCSQFVAQCYYDAGPDYNLKIENGVLSRSVSERGEGKSLLEQAADVIERKDFQPSLSLDGLALEIEAGPSAEDLCRELKEALTADAVEESPEISRDLTEAVVQFSKVYYLSQGDETGRDASRLLKKMSEDENMFKFPGDLLNHCVNLKDAGKIE